MKASHYYLILALVVLIIVAAWLGILQGLCQWLWDLVHGIPPVSHA